jgi:hypothetical protein
MGEVDENVKNTKIPGRVFRTERSILNPCYVIWKYLGNGYAIARTPIIFVCNWVQNLRHRTDPFVHQWKFYETNNKTMVLNFHTTFPRSQGGSGRQNGLIDWLTVSCKSTCIFHYMIRPWWWRQHVPRKCPQNSQISLGVRSPKQKQHLEWIFTKT